MKWALDRSPEIELTDLSPAMADAKIAAAKDSMYCAWLKSRQKDCRRRAVNDSLDAEVSRWGGAYTPEGGCE